MLFVNVQYGCTLTASPRRGISSVIPGRILECINIGRPKEVMEVQTPPFFQQCFNIFFLQRWGGKILRNISSYSVPGPQNDPETGHISKYFPWEAYGAAHPSNPWLNWIASGTPCRLSHTKVKIVATSMTWNLWMWRSYLTRPIE